MGGRKPFDGSGDLGVVGALGDFGSSSPPSNMVETGRDALAL
jgi:hypothetical protein